MYFLCRGEVKLSVQGLSGSRRIVSILSAARSPGDMLDKPSLGAAVHAMTCETLTESLVCCVNKTDWLWWVRQDQELVDRVLTAAGNETIGLLRQLRENLDVQAGRKLARTLLSLADQHGLPTPQGIELDLKLRRREWAELVGLSRETVARLLNGLRRDGVLALSGNRITIVGYDRLAKLA
jgi:CRP/FNR family transcriptional regulator